MTLEQFVQQFSQALTQGNAFSLLIAAGAGFICSRAGGLFIAFLT